MFELSAPYTEETLPQACHAGFLSFALGTGFAILDVTHCGRASFDSNTTTTGFRPRLVVRRDHADVC